MKDRLLEIARMEFSKLNPELVSEACGILASNTLLDDDLTSKLMFGRNSEDNSKIKSLIDIELQSDDASSMLYNILKYAIINNIKIGDDNAIEWADNKGFNKSHVLTKLILEEHLKNRRILNENQTIKVGKKEKGVTKGGLFTGPSNANIYVQKESYRFGGSYTDDEFFAMRDNATEYLAGSIYNLLDSLTPVINLVVGKDELVTSEFSKVVELQNDETNNNIKITSKFVKNKVCDLADALFKGFKEYIEPSQIHGIANVLAASIIMGEIDYHSGNIIVVNVGTKEVPNYRLVKIDHGRTFLNVYDDVNKLIKNFLDKNTNYGYEKLTLDIETFKNELIRMINILENNEKGADYKEILYSKEYTLRKLGFKIEESNPIFYYLNDKQIIEPPYKAPTEYLQNDESSEDFILTPLSDHFIKRIETNIKTAKQLIEILEFISKIERSEATVNRNNFVYKCTIEGKEPSEWLKTNKSLICGKDPLEWVNENKDLINKLMNKFKPPVGLNESQTHTVVVFEDKIKISNKDTSSHYSYGQSNYESSSKEFTPVLRNYNNIKKQISQSGSSHKRTNSESRSSDGPDDDSDDEFTPVVKMYRKSYNIKQDESSSSSSRKRSNSESKSSDNSEDEFTPVKKKSWRQQVNESRQDSTRGKS